MAGILLKDVRTHNLKNIGVKIPHNQITVITGISGSGKTSLAIHTLYELCRQEFNSLENGYIGRPRFSLSSYEGIVPSIAIRQKNTNVNPRSSLYTYLNIPSILENAFIYGDCQLKPSDLSINSVDNYCNRCNGLGYIHEIDKSLIINDSLSLKEMPFINWKKSASSHHLPLLLSFCADNNIPTDIPFVNLSTHDKKEVLYGKSEKIYKISFKINGKRRSRVFAYMGPLAELDSLEDSAHRSDLLKIDKYSRDVICPACSGARFKPALLKGSVYGLTLQRFMTTEFQSLASEINSYGRTKPEYPAFEQFKQLLKSLLAAGIGYLDFSRSIPTLSGGEIQKLNLARITCSKISGALFVLDEISSQLHVSEFANIYDILRFSVERKNTVVMVEQSDYFAKKADTVICIGPGSGKNGGEIVACDIPSADYEFPKREITSFITLPPITKNNVQELSVRIPEGGLTGLCGVSGSGKSSFARGLAETLDNVEFISQRQLRGNIRSTIATFMDMQKKIATLFSNQNCISEDWFLCASGKIGACPTCDGRGRIKFERSYEEPIYVECDTCHGSRFNPEVKKYLYKGIDVENLYASDIDTIIEDKLFEGSSLYGQLSLLKKLALSHLSIGRDVSSLSGGEAQRLKIARGLQKCGKNKILIVDEPGAGLDSKSINLFLEELQLRVKNYLAVIVIDHKLQVLRAMDYLLEFGPGSGKSGGRIIAAGQFLNSPDSIIGPFLYGQEAQAR